MISNMNNAGNAFVWIWLPEKVSPIVAGRLKKVKELYSFTYGKSYLENPEATPLSTFELPQI